MITIKKIKQWKQNHLTVFISLQTQDTHTFIHRCPLVRSLTRSFVRSFTCSLVRLFFRSLVLSFVCLFIHSFARSLVRSLVRMFARLLVNSLTRSRSFVRSFARSLIRSGQDNGIFPPPTGGRAFVHSYLDESQPVFHQLANKNAPRKLGQQPG